MMTNYHEIMKLALIALFLPALLSGQSEYRGKLAPELAVEAESLDSIDFRLATAQEKERLGETTSRVFAGQIAGAPAFSSTATSRSCMSGWGRSGNFR